MNDLLAGLGWALIHFLWQGTLIALLLLFVLRVLRDRSANCRYVAGYVALVSMAVCLPATFFVQKEREGETLPAVDRLDERDARTQWETLTKLNPSDAGLEDHDTSGGLTAVGSRLRFSQERHPWSVWVVAIWGTGVALLALWRSMGFVGIVRMRRRAVRRAVPEDIAILVDELRIRLGVGMKVLVRLSEKSVVPVVTGVLRPMILLPACAVTGMNRNRIEAVLAHELAHVRRHDYLLNVVQVMIETLLFYHPAIWWVGKRIRREREHCCDDLALEVCQDRRTYANALRGLAELAFAPKPGVAAVSDRKQLLPRLRRILGFHPDRDGGGGPWLAGGILALLIVAISLAGSAVAQQPDSADNTHEGSFKKVAFVNGARGHITDRNGKVLAGGDPYMRLLFDSHLPVVREESEEEEQAFQKYLDDQLIPALRKHGISLEAEAVMQVRAKWKRKRHFEWTLDSGEPAEEKFRLSGDQLGIPRVVVERLTRRTYPMRALAAHSIGYISTRDGKGRWGVEKSADEHLRGSVREVERRFDAEGRLLREIAKGSKAGGPGRDVVLTMDVRKQFVIEKTLRDAKIGRGAVVLLDSNSGGVLAMASVPSYDLNSFIPVLEAKQFKGYRDNEAMPLLNRAIAASYPPASTVKVYSALVGGDRETYACSGSHQIGERAFKCWQRKGHGELDLRNALVQSCNCYFYQSAIEVGVEQLVPVFSRFQFGRKSGIELEGEVAGFLPTPKLVKDRYDIDWNDADTANLTIGHGLLEATPMQQAAAMSAIANGGRYHAPRLLLGVKSDGKLGRFERPKPISLLDAIKTKRLEMVRLAMHDVVNGKSGTGRRAQSKLLTIAGKTGTAQWKPNREHLAWFSGFAPFENPTHVLSIVVEGGKGGGSVAAPLAKRILEACHRIDHGKAPKVVPLAPAVGHLDPVEGVTFAD